MKSLGIFLLFWLPTFVSAQSLPIYNVQVVAESAFTRAIPTPEARATASVFANDNLIAIGRNIDGTWLEVRRPGQRHSVGWIERDLVLATFDLGQVPITDLTTGLVGPDPVYDTGFSILTIDDAPLRTAPDRAASILEEIPVFQTLPVMERTPDNQWLKVNFRGWVGWVPQFLTSTRGDLTKVPLSSGYAQDTRYAAFVTITPEQQLAQVDRLLNFIASLNQTAADVAFYWASMSQGETMECKPPAGNFPYYTITAQDVVELPELRQQERLMTQAVDDLNASIDVMHTCGIYTQQAVRSAYAKALNAQNIFRQVVQHMESTRIRITDDHRNVPTEDGS